MRVCAHVYVLSVCARVCVCAPMHMIMFVQIYMHMHAQSKICIYIIYIVHITQIYIYITHYITYSFISYFMHIWIRTNAYTVIILDINDINVSI